jgi:hypothetical protein
MTFPAEPFATFLANAPLAGPVGSSDVIALLQAGLIKQLPANVIPQLTTVPSQTVNVSTYNATLTDQAILVNRSPAAATVINLPSNPGIGRRVLVKDIAGNCDLTNDITISNATIDGVAGLVLNTGYAYVWLLSTGNGNEWANVT